LRKYRSLFGGNFRRVVIIGNGKSVPLLEDFFNNNPDYGYKLEQSYSLNDNKKTQIEKCLKFVSENNIDEIYCSLHDLANTYVNQVIDFADNNLKVVKFLPDNNEIFTKNLKFEYQNVVT
jgi:putative colanic acid biosynthesis UDP-glucose lipid carrier transferase